MIKRYNTTKNKRQARVRSKLFGTTQRPRLSVFRSNQHIYAQIINDETGTTLVSASDKDLKTQKATKTEIANLVGKELAQKAQKAKITKICFDRGAYKFHGRVKALAQAARENGLEF